MTTKKKTTTKKKPGPKCDSNRRELPSEAYIVTYDENYGEPGVMYSTSNLCQTSPNLYGHGALPEYGRSFANSVLMSKEDLVNIFKKHDLKNVKVFRVDLSTPVQLEFTPAKVEFKV